MFEFLSFDRLRIGEKEDKRSSLFWVLKAERVVDISYNMRIEFIPNFDSLINKCICYGLGYGYKKSPKKRQRPILEKIVEIRDLKEFSYLLNSFNSFWRR